MVRLSPRRILQAATTLAVAYLLSGAVATYVITRGGDRHEEASPSGAESLRLRTDDGLALGAWRGGVGPVCVLVFHGIRGTRSMLRDRFDWLVSRGYRVITVTARGHGDSDDALVDAGWSAAGDVRAAVHVAREDPQCGPVVVWGYSMGAAMALFASRGLDASGYVLEAPYERLDATIRNRLDVRLPEPLASLAEADLWLFGHLMPRHPEAIRPIDHVRQIPSGIPLLLVSGDADTKAPLVGVRRMAATRPGTEVLVLRGATHEAAFRTHHARYAAALMEFFSRIETAPAADSTR